MSTGTDSEATPENNKDKIRRQPKKASSSASKNGKQRKPAGGKKTGKKPALKKTRSANGAKATGTTMKGKGKRSRTSWPFPTGTFQDALEFATSIQTHGSGQPIRRLTLFDTLGKSPESSSSRQLITAANKYNLVVGGYQAETLELTDEGKLATDEDADPREQARARVKLAIQQIEPFNAVYERYAGNKMPVRAVLIDAMKEAAVPRELCEQAVDTFTVNAQFVGILRTLSGAERIITVEHLLGEIKDDRQARVVHTNKAAGTPISKDATGFDRICFYITAIGDEGSEHRIHSDMFSGSIVEPALEPLKLEVVRADKIDKPGLITKQVIEYLLKSKLVVADLSFHNPNVFYELAIRHMMRLPIVQLIRKSDKIPFDVNQNRTIPIDCSSAYGIAPQLDTYKAQIAAQARSALDEADASDNPVSLFWPSLKVAL